VARPYGPEELWPRHPDARFREALGFARDAGWWFLGFTGHSFGKVVCQGPDRATGRCEFLVLISGRARENAAKDLENKVRRCPHRMPTEQLTHETHAREALRRARRLVDAAEQCVAGDAKLRRARELLDDALHLIDSAPALGRAIVLEADGARDREYAAAAAREEGYPDGQPIAPGPLAAAGSERLADAEQSLRRTAASSTHRKLQVEADALRRDIANLQARAASDDP
jgi:hypothetical protein